MISHFDIRYFALISDFDIRNFALISDFDNRDVFTLLQQLPSVFSKSVECSFIVLFIVCIAGGLVISNPGCMLM